MINRRIAALAAMAVRWMTLTPAVALPNGGETIKSVKVGWESAGTLNADKSNAILITHFFSGTSHAFGKYSAEDKTAGYWDAIIGPGKAIDTNKYFVLSSDTLVNLNVNTPNVVTTGPASINPDTGKPYGMSFPVVGIKDFVRVEKALIDSLGITRLKAVVGASMGGLQAYEWAQSFPDSVERIDRLARYVDATDPARSEMEQWRLLWQGAAARRAEGRAQTGHFAGQQLGVGARDVRNGAGRSGQRSGEGDWQQIQNRGLSRSGRDRARRFGRCQSFPLPLQGQPACRRRSGEYQSACAGALCAERPRILRADRPRDLGKNRRGGWFGRKRGTGRAQRTSQCFHRDRAGRRQNRSISREITASAV